MKKIILILATVFVFSNCTSTTGTYTRETDLIPTKIKSSISLTVDGVTTTYAGLEDGVSSVYDVEKFWTLNFSSDKKGYDFGLYLNRPLTVGTYQIYNCKTGPNRVECDDDRYEKIEFVKYGPHLREPFNHEEVKSAYSIAELNLSPVTMVIKSITDYAEPDNYIPAKRITGTIAGTLAHVRKTQTAAPWHEIVGKAIIIEGSFDVVSYKKPL
jgi:hypothetical protein